VLTFRPMDNAPAIIDRLYELIEAGDVERLAMLYSSDGEIIRYDGVASGKAEIIAYYRDHLARHPGSALRQVDKVQTAGDVLMWDALVDSHAGVRQTIDVIILDGEGLIRRHIPGFRGYWGR
jgi:predicted SnoaL-like aldol condensation-catalyzing enzyme